MEIKDLAEKLVIRPTSSLEEEYERSITFFQDNGFNVYRPDYLNDNIIAKSFTKIFNIYQEKDKIKHSFFVLNTPWDEEKVNLILNSFSQPSEVSKVYFLSAYPLPDILAFIGKNLPASFFELEAIRNFKNFNESLSQPDSLENYFKLLNNLSQKYFQIEVNDIPAQGLKAIEKIIINDFRNGRDYDQLYDTDIEYFPHYSLLLISMYVSYLMMKNFTGELFYDSSKDIKELGIGFSTENNDMIDVMAHPVNRVFNFFIYGKDASIINWYYELKYFFSNKTANKE